MRRWVWRVLLIVAVMAALTVGAAAADTIVTENGIKYNLTTGTVVGPVNKDGPVSILVKASVNGTPITSIAESAFNGCGKLRTVEIESGITAIGPSAFNSCPLLETVLFPDTITAIDSFAFANCVKLNKVVMPPLVTTIKSGTFAGCTSLSSIYIGSVGNVEADAFSDTKVKYLHCADDQGPGQIDDPPLEVHRTTQIPGVKVDPTCTGNGNQAYSYSCSVCKTAFNFSQDHPIPALGHLPGPEIAEVPSTCSKDGTTAGHRCIRDGCNGIADGLERIPKDPKDPAKHNATLTDVPGEAASCTKPGLTEGKRCPDCGTMVTPQTEIPQTAHTYEDKEQTIRDATCSEAGLKGTFKICSVCNAAEECEDCEKLKGNQEEYEQHIKDKHSGAETVTKDHTPGGSKYVVTTPAACDKEGEETWKVTCSVCGKGLENGENPPDGLTRTIPATGHTPTKKEVDQDKSKPGTCLEDGETVYKETTCTKCGQTFTPNPEKVEAPGSHAYKDIPEKTIKDATCAETGLKEVGGKECTACGDKVSPRTEPIPKIAHTWANPQPDDSQEDVPATCGKEGESHVIATCSVCGKTEARTIKLPATGLHNWGEWEITEPTETQPGEKKRVCDTCEEEDIVVLPATGDPSDSDDPDDPDGPDKPEPAYLVNLVQGAGGSVSSNKSSAKSGDRVTLTIWAESGYELDMIRVVSASGGVPSVTDLGGNQHRFTMPASNVEVRVTFVRKSAGSAWSSSWASAPGDGADGNPRRTTDPMPTQSPAQSVPRAGVSDQLFRDIPASHWAAGEISWANQMGYMNGSGGRFNPDGTITHQQMWMVLARITGSRPANMTEARRWAVENSFADGSSPTGAVARHQLVTALYRCAHLVGSTNRNTTSLAGYTDSRTVPTVARDAFSWAVANGIVGGTANGRLDPNGTLTRAQFAVILYRYSQRI